jgi:hypothetical protein
MSGWFFRYLDRQQSWKQSRQFSTKEEALTGACAYRQHGYAITSLEGPGVRMTAVDVAKWCVDHSV